MEESRGSGQKAFFGHGCSDRWVRYPDIEHVFTRGIGEVLRSCPKLVMDPDVRAHRLQQIRVRLHVLRARHASIEADRPLNWQHSRPIRDVAQQTVTEMERLLDERKKLRIDRPRWLDVVLQPRLARLGEIARADDVDRHGLNIALRGLLERVIVDWPNDRLVLDWKHGGQSTIAMSFAPQRLVSNPRRSDKLRLGPGKEPVPLPNVAR